MALAVGLGLTACADPTGEIDDQGHNGYDAMTCEQAKSLALDIEYGTVYAPGASSRISDLTHVAAKAAHPQVRAAAMALISGYRAQNRALVSTASAALVQVCEM